jgi:putative sterol carrier protein
MPDVDLTSDRFMGGVIAASSHRAGSGTSGLVALSTTSAQVGLEIVDGRVVGPVAATETAVAVPLTGPQLQAILDGSMSMAQAFMRGDIKPEGATGALLALIELFEDDDFRRRLAEHV